MRTNHRTVIN
jgi:hypothetical protein